MPNVAHDRRSILKPVTTSLGRRSHSATVRVDASDDLGWLPISTVATAFGLTAFGSSRCDPKRYSNQAADRPTPSTGESQSVSQPHSAMLTVATLAGGTATVRAAEFDLLIQSRASGFEVERREVGLCLPALDTCLGPALLACSGRLVVARSVTEVWP